MQDQTTWMQDAQEAYLQGEQLPQVHISTPDQTLKLHPPGPIPTPGRPTLASIRAPTSLAFEGLQGVWYHQQGEISMGHVETFQTKEERGNKFPAAFAQQFFILN